MNSRASTEGTLKNNYTPGPWYVFGGVHVRSEAQNPAVASCNTTHGLGDWKDVEKANARLIAAAPDLLAALQAVLDFEDDQVSGPWPQAVAAIKKATGA